MDEFFITKKIKLELGLDGASWYKGSQGQLNYKTIFILHRTRPQFIVHRKGMKHIRCVPTIGHSFNPPEAQTRSSLATLHC